jgi:5-methyltetrahydropteroyltriglutamate--homocysteine methyltransferase
MPDWLGRFKTSYHRGRLSAAGLTEIEEVAIKAALMDQDLAGVDIVSDGEYRRDNDIDYLVEAIAGVELLGGPKDHYFNYREAVVRRPLNDEGEIDTTGLLEAFRFARELTDHVLVVSLAGPFSLSKRLHNEAYDDERDLVLALARVLSTAARALVGAGATHIQFDEPFLAGYPEAAEWVMRAVNSITAGIEANFALHVCYGNRFARPAWEGHYDFLFPSVLEANIDELVLEFARKGLDDLELVRRYPTEFDIGIGVIDVKSTAVEPVELIEQRLYQAIKVIAPERLVVNPDCGLRNLPARVAKAKLTAMATAAANVRADVLGTRPTETKAAARPALSKTTPPVGSATGEPRLDVVGVGNAIVDMFVTVGHEQVSALGLELGSMTLVDDLTSERFTAATGSTRGVSGGSAANTIVGLVGCGGSGGYIAHVGSDPVGSFFIEDLREAGVEFERPTRQRPGPGTGRCLALVTPEGERTMATYLGASLLIEPEDLAEAMISRAKVVYLEGYLADAPRGHDVLREAVQCARAGRAEIALSLSDAFCVERHYELFKELASAADIVFANESEARLLSGESDLERASAFFAELCGAAVLTLGERGSRVVLGEHRYDIEAFPVELVLDRTGAGDLYASGFLYGWTHGADPATCGELGSLAASEIVGHIGARPETSLRELMGGLGFDERLDTGARA